MSEPTPTPAGAFERTLLVHFHEIDRAGIVYFARIFEYCHRVYEELLAEVVGPLEAFFQQKDWGLPLVHAEADYARPLRLGDRVRVRLVVERLGERSVTFGYTLTCAATGEPRATARLVHACVTLRPAFAPRAMHPDYVAGLRGAGLLPG
ncbi:MAG: acyl-CoA thioesterase [Planctomycetes bacterium]|nr:acyl-CoA thioesterase [Planctomycetota bacterium]